MQSAADTLDLTRKIIHVDMDAFYASVEQRDFPELRGKPIAVGGGSERGVVCTASYEARKFGVRSAMSGHKARELCPNLIFVPTRFDAYKTASAAIREIFHDYTDLVEPLSLDEAYLDVTNNNYDIPYATTIAKEIRARIFDQTGLTASAGVSYNKFLAKSASDIQKPNGMTVILPDDAPAFLEGLKIEKFHGIGKVTAAKMKSFGVFNGKDLKSKSDHWLNRNFGKSGLYYYHIVRGQDNRRVSPDRIRKSISVENTFAKNLTDKNAMLYELDKMTHDLYARMEKAKANGHTVTLKVKFADFELITRRVTSGCVIHDVTKIKEHASFLLEKLSIEKPVRLLGVGLSSLIERTNQEESPKQLDLI